MKSVGSGFFFLSSLSSSLDLSPGFFPGGSALSSVTASDIVRMEFAPRFHSLARVAGSDIEYTATGADAL